MTLNDETEATNGLRRAGELVEAVRAKVREWREPPERTRVFTSALMDDAKRTGAQGAMTAKTSGTVKWFSDIRGYGFINSDDGGEVFVHWSGIAGQGYRYVHLLTEDEVQALAADSGYHVVGQFEADNELNLYSILKRV